MAVRIVQLGSARARGEGIRIGTVRRTPRGIAKESYARLDYYDVWMPELAPSISLLQRYRSHADDPRIWERFMLQYEKEMEKPPAARILRLLALLSRNADFAAGCYCADESRCHRSVLRALLKRHGAAISERWPIVP